MSYIKKGAGILGGCLMSVSGIAISVFSFIGLVAFPKIGFSAITIIFGVVFSIFGIKLIINAATYEDISESSVKTEEEINEHTSYEELQKIIKKRGW